MDYKNLEMLSRLVSLFRNAGERGITYEEIAANLEKDESLNFALSKRSFHNYLNELRNRFGITIVCDRKLEDSSYSRKISDSNKRYRYRLIDEPARDNAPWTMPYLWAVEASIAMKQLREAGLSEQNVLIDNEPPGTDRVKILLEAIRQRRYINIKYREPNSRHPIPYDNFEPISLVMKNYIWYLLGVSDGWLKKIMPLYRTSEISITDKTFRPDLSFSPSKFWRDNYESQLGSKDIWLMD